MRRSRSLKESVLHRNAFCVMGATSRDNRRRIVELAGEKALEIDHDVCQKACSELTNPRTRLTAEIAWLPGVSPRKACQLADQLLRDPMSIRVEPGLPPLAHANLMAAAFDAVEAEDEPQDVARFIREIAEVASEVSVDHVMRDINEDRAVSGFPEVTAEDQIEAELAERKRYFRNAAKEALNRLPTSSMVDAITLVVEHSTAKGETHAPELIDDLVDSYELETQDFFQKEAENVNKLIKVVRDAAKSGESAANPLIDRLEAVARNWDKVAQPIQLSARARGTKHSLSNHLAVSIRSLAIDLFNEHGMMAQSKRLLALLQDIFAELPEVSEQLEQDADALEKIFHNRREAEARRTEWEREITYEAEIGLVFKDKLSISPKGVEWKSHHYPLDAITRTRWGGVRESRIPTGTTTTYTIAFGDDRSEAVVEMRKEEVFSTFIDKLWRAVGVRLLTELLEILKSGREIRFGDAIVRDDGVILTKHRFLIAHERVPCSWDQVNVWSANGAFCIGAKDGKKTYAALPYIEQPNAHILEAAVRMAFKKPGLRKLSDLLQGD